MSNLCDSVNNRKLFLSAWTSTSSSVTEELQRICVVHVMLASTIFWQHRVWSPCPSSTTAVRCTVRASSLLVLRTESINWRKTWVYLSLNIGGENCRCILWKLWNQWNCDDPSGLILNMHFVRSTAKICSAMQMQMQKYHIKKTMR